MNPREWIDQIPTGRAVVDLKPVLHAGSIRALRADNGNKVPTGVRAERRWNARIKPSPRSRVNRGNLQLPAVGSMGRRSDRLIEIASEPFQRSLYGI